MLLTERLVSLFRKTLRTVLAVKGSLRRAWRRVRFVGLQQ